MGVQCRYHTVKKDAVYEQYTDKQLPGLSGDHHRDFVGHFAAFAVDLFS